jgi:glycosyltransferase involved in cell wall biosynthesis
MRKLLFLSSQFTGYFYECLKGLVDNHDYQVQVIRWESSINVPYQFSEYQNIIINSKDDFTLKELLEKCLNFQPDIVYYPGWMDKDYLKIVAQLRHKGTISIMGFDNQWHGSIKQRVIALMGYQIFKKLFKSDYVWVAGEQQAEYLNRIGFPKTKILFGLYSANQPVLYAEYQHFKLFKSADYPKRFLYVGRFEKVKNVRLLYQVFKSIVEENLHKGWSLTMVGEGTEEIYLQPSQNIEIRSFIQPQELVKIIPKFGCFVLPSLHEPWGVVVHEAVSSGLPLISSSVAGAGTLFLQEGKNGFLFDVTDAKNLKNTLLKIINSSDDSLIKMSEKSAELSFQVTPKSWAKTLSSVSPLIV